MEPVGQGSQDPPQSMSTSSPSATPFEHTSPVVVAGAESLLVLVSLVSEPELVRAGPVLEPLDGVSVALLVVDWVGLVEEGPDTAEVEPDAAVDEPEVAPCVEPSGALLSHPHNISAIASAPVPQPVSIAPRVPLRRGRWPQRALGSTFRDMDDRIVELEVRTAYQDKTIADLDEVIRAFTERVVVLERELRLLKETMKAGAPDVGPQDEKPPHY